MNVEDWVELPSHVRFEAVTFANDPDRIVGRKQDENVAIQPATPPWYEFIVREPRQAHSIIAALTGTLGPDSKWDEKDTFVQAVIAAVQRYREDTKLEVPFAEQYAYALFANERYDVRLDEVTAAALAEGVCGVVERRTGRRRQRIAQEPIDVTEAGRAAAEYVIEATSPTVPLDREHRPDAEKFVDLLQITHVESRMEQEFSEIQKTSL